MALAFALHSALVGATDAVVNNLDEGIQPGVNFDSSGINGGPESSGSVDRCTIHGNAGAGGGGIKDFGALTISNTTISGNSSTPAPGFDPASNPIRTFGISFFPGLDDSFEHQSDLSSPFTPIGESLNADAFTTSVALTLDSGRGISRSRVTMVDEQIADEYTSKIACCMALISCIGSPRSMDAMSPPE